MENYKNTYKIKKGIFLEMKAKEVKKYILISLALIIVSVMSVHFYNKYRIRQEYIEKEIYEVGKTFEIVSSEYIYVYCMVCEPPLDRETLKEMAKDFIVKNNFINDLKSRVPDFQGEKVGINFVKAFKGFSNRLE